MKAVLLEHRPPGGARTPLEGHLPLSTPYVVQIFPIYACNCICKYCHFSIEKSKRCFVTDRIAMDMRLYEKCLDDMAGFPEKIRTLRFVGMGEPLLHREIVRMTAAAKRRNIAERVEILTNGALLTPDLSDRLIAAGLDRLVVSLQGTSAAKYRAVAGIDPDFEHFLDQLRYVYLHRQHTHIHIKIVDIALDGEADEKHFFALFGDICDTIGIEKAVPIFPGVAYNSRLAGRKSITQFGTPVVADAICPQPFFTLQINPDGKVVGCYSVAYPEILGDCNNETLTGIWNGARYNSFRRRMLRGRETVCEVCRDCNINMYRMQPEDAIVNENGRLNELYGPIFC
jgi:radical SAM protein with 4Fe4S-binding SPASM domain